MCLLHNIRDKPFTLGIQVFEVRVRPRRRVLVSGGKKIKSVYRVIHPACGVDARTNNESDIVFGKIPLVNGEIPEELHEPVPRALAKHFEAVVRKRPVLTGKRHHVGNRRDRDHIKKPFLPPLRHGKHTELAAARKKRLHELERNTSSAEMPIRVGIIFAVRIYDRTCGRQFVTHDAILARLLMRQMVVGYDDINARFLRHCNFFNIGDAAIRGHDNTRAFARELHDRSGIEPISFAVPVGNIILEIGIPDFFEEIVKNDPCRSAVSVVVGVDDNIFVALNSFEYPRDRRIHILEEKRIMEMSAVIRVQKCRNFFVAGNPPLFKQGFYKRFGHAEEYTMRALRSTERPFAAIRLPNSVCDRHVGGYGVFPGRDLLRFHRPAPAERFR